MRFDYCGQYGDMTCREVEPVQLLFKEYTWYMRAYCRVRGAMRLFKVLRMKRAEILEEAFALGERHREERSGIGKETEETSGETKSHKAEEIIFRIDRKEAYRVYDRFEENEIRVLSDGDFEIRMWCVVDDWVYGLILSFGPSARVLEPDWVREELRGRIRQLAEMYGT